MFTAAKSLRLYKIVGPDFSGTDEELLEDLVTVISALWAVMSNLERVLFCSESMSWWHPDPKYHKASSNRNIRDIFNWIGQKKIHAITEN